MTAKRRASQQGRKNPFITGFATDAPTASAGPVQSKPTAPSPAPATGTGEKPSFTTYSARLDTETAATFDDLITSARRKLGRRVDKAEFLRAWILLTADDVSLRDQVIAEVDRTSSGGKPTRTAGA